MGQFSKNLNMAADNAERLARAMGSLKGTGGGGESSSPPRDALAAGTPSTVNFFTTLEKGTSGGGGSSGGGKLLFKNDQVQRLLSAINSLNRENRFGLLMRSGGGG